MASRFLSSRSKTLALTFTRALNPSLSSSSQYLHGFNSVGSSPPPPPDRRSAGSSFFSPFGSSKVFPCRPYQVLYGGGGHPKSVALRCFAEAHSRGMKHEADIAQSTTAEVHISSFEKKK